MVEQPQAIENNTAQDKEREDRQKNRTKATFSLLDHSIKIYNNTETYLKRGLTLFGLGSIIAGASFSVGQRLPNNEVTLPQNFSDTPSSNLSSTSTPQPPVNPTPQLNYPQPQIIYVTPPPMQSITVPKPKPIKTSTLAEIKPEPVVTSPSSTPKTIPTNPQPEPVVTSPSSTPKTTPTNPQPEPVVTSPPSIPKTTPTNPQPEPVVTLPPINSLPVPEELAQVKQKVDSFQQILGTISSSLGKAKSADIQQDLNPILGEEDD